MRLDKYLKVSRIIKRRTIAKEVADQGRIKINSQTAKSSTDVKIGDQLEISFANRIVKVQVESLQESTKKEDAEKMYQLISEEKIQDNL